MYAFLFIYIDNIVKIYLKKGLLHWYTYIYIYIYIYSDNTFYIDVGNESSIIVIVVIIVFMDFVVIVRCPLYMCVCWLFFSPWN